MTSPRGLELDKAVLSSDFVVEVVKGKFHGASIRRDGDEGEDSDNADQLVHHDSHSGYIMTSKHSE
jgi:hypothetical protein